MTDCRRMITLFLSLILTFCFVLRVTDGQALGFVLNGVTYSNGSTVLRTDIGEGDAALQCTTDRAGCCRLIDGTAAGEFYFPSGAQVPTLGTDPSIRTYYRNRGIGFIRLNRRSVATETGPFRCEIPDASGITVNLFINIVSVTITTIGSPTVGNPYTLKCSVSGTSDPASYQWFGPNGESITNSSSRMVFSNSSLTLLEFSPLQASHAGDYTCRATVNGVVTENTASVTVMIPPSTATVRDNGVIPTLSQQYQLTCDVTGVENLNPTLTYQWTKNNGTQTQVGTNSNTLLFTSLKLSDAGRYKCVVTIASVSLSENIHVTAFKNVIVQIPAPTAVMVTPPSSTIIAGSSPNLTCTVELSPSVDVPVTVEIVWSGPALTTVTTTNLMMESLTRYTILGMVDEARNGSYTCQATVSSSSEFTTGGGMTSGSTTITVGPLPPPTDLLVSRPSLATSISLSWEQPLGADAVQSYQINYNYTINECSRDSVGQIMQGSVNVGNVRTYNLSNSPQTSVEEDSVYSITITAVNNAVSSTPSATRMTTTAPAAPSGAPQNLQALVVNATSITLQWSKMACQHRNGMIDGYQISYSGVNVTVTNENTFIANRLLPRKKYTFSVNAFSRSFDPGLQVTITNETSPVQEVTFVLNGHIYSNNSIVIVDDIAVNDGALLCYTNSVVCCSSSRQGEWYFPSGAPVGTSGDRGGFYRNRGPSVVRLNRRNNAMMPTGVFLCEIPDASGTNQSIYIGIYPRGEAPLPTTTATPAPVQMTIGFKLTSPQDSTVITFSLTCNSTGGPVSSVIWTRDGLLLNNTSPLVLTDASTASYTNVLQVNGRTPGTYTCQIRGDDNQILSSMDYNVHAAAPPLNVQATQASASAPVEVSWSHPFSGATSITGYRIFYGNGENASIPPKVTGIKLALNKDSVGETVSLRSEADQLASQLITVAVTTPTEAATKSSHSSALDVGVTFGIMLLLLCVVSVVFTLVLIFMWRKRRVRENGSTTMPTQLYEDPDKLISRGQGNFELTHCPAYESTTTKPEPPPRTQAEVDQSSHYEL